MAVAYRINEESDKTDKITLELQKAQIEAANANGEGIVAASHDNLTTGFDWEYFSRLHIGATAWYIFSEMNYNPYWGDCISDIDTDNDGTPDCKDICKDDPRKIDSGECGCGVADTDSDGDGILDCEDSLPTDPYIIIHADDNHHDNDEPFNCFFSSVLRDWTKRHKPLNYQEIIDILKSHLD